MSQHLIKVPKHRQEMLEKAKKRKRELQAKGIDMNLFDIMFDIESKEKEEPFMGFRL